tara:strand:+ start:110 stop:1891 length:1782 start_codon:yes stop_codon:yes gene_type:complete
MVFILLSTTLSGCTTPDTIDEEPIGCTYLDALNFNDSAVLDDGSCQFSQPPQVTAGCSYEGALNFDETASVDDGSCQFSRPSEEMLGCIYSNALNFDENATEDDGTCVFRPYIIFGCDDSDALNFASNTTYNDGSCEYQTRHVLMVLVDGWRPDSIAVGYTPTIDSMLPESAYSMAARVEDTTISGSGHSSFLTGVHRDKHNVNGNNFDDHNYEQYPYWFRLLRDSVPDTHRSAYHNWPSMSNAALDDSVCSGCGDYFQGNDQTIVDELILDLASKQMNAATLVLDIMDAYGHSTGFNSSNSDYMAGMNQTDLWLGEIMDAIKARSNYQNEEWMVIISSDHAGTDRGHGYNIPEHRNVPLIIWGAESMGEIWPHPDAVDAVPTALHHLGVEIEPAWNLDGRVLGIEGTTKPVAELGVNLVFNGDGEYERGMTPGYDASIPGWVDNSTMTTWIYNIPTYLQSTDPGTEERGANYFGGGSEDSSIHQVIDLSGISEEISRGNLTYILSAFIGGYSDQDDRMEVVVEFFDSNGGLILYEAIGPVYAVDRNEITGIYLREAWGQVPEDSSWVRVTLNAYHETGYNDAYADDIVLVIS